MSKLNRIKRLANKLPNQVIMEDGFILIKASELTVKSFNKGKVAGTMTISINIDLNEIKEMKL